MMDTPYLRRLAEIESGINPLAQNPRSSAKGMFQFIDSTGLQYGLDPSQFGTAAYAQAEIPAAEKLTQDNRAYLTKALGREPTAGELYLAHQQGAAGAAKILTNPNVPAIQIVGQDAVLNNGGSPEITSQEFANQWIDKFNSGYQEPAVEEFIQVETPDGIVEFPSNMTDEQIAEVLRKEYPAPEPAQPTLTPAQEFANEHPILRTLGRTARAGASGLSSLADLGLLVPKTAALAGGMALENLGATEVGNALQRFGATPTMADTTRQIIDNATGGKLQPTGAIDKAGDLVGEIISSSVPFARGADTIGMLPKSPGPGEALRALMDPETALNQLPKVQAQKQAMGPVSEIISGQANKAYQFADEAGGMLKPEATNAFIDDIGKKVLPQTSKGKTLSGNNVVTQVMDSIKEFKDQPTSLAEAQEIDEILGDFIDSEFKITGLSKQGKKILDIQNSFREMIENATEDMVDNKAGFEALKEGRKLWSKSRKIQDIERIIARAEMSEQPANAIKSGFKTLANNPKRIRGFSKEEQKLIRQAADEGLALEALRGVASRLTGIISGATGGPVGYALGKGAEMGARGIREKAMTGRAESIIDAISGLPKPVSQPLLTNQGALAALAATNTAGQQMLPPPPLQITVRPNSQRGY